MQPGINLPAFRSNVCKFLPDNTESQVLFYTKHRCTMFLRNVRKFLSDCPLSQILLHANGEVRSVCYSELYNTTQSPVSHKHSDTRLSWPPQVPFQAAQLVQIAKSGNEPTLWKLNGAWSRVQMYRSECTDRCRVWQQLYNLSMFWDLK